MGINVQLDDGRVSAALRRVNYTTDIVVELTEPYGLGEGDGTTLAHRDDALEAARELIRRLEAIK